jgi:hypothetical protein
MKPSTRRIERLLAKVEADLACSAHREIRACSCAQPKASTGQTIAFRKRTGRLRQNLEGRLFDSIGPVPVVFTHPLDKHKLAFGGHFIRNAVGDTWQNFVSLTDRERASIVRTAGSMVRVPCSTK